MKDFKKEKDRLINEFNQQLLKLEIEEKLINNLPILGNCDIFVITKYDKPLVFIGYNKNHYVPISKIIEFAPVTNKTTKVIDHLINSPFKLSICNKVQFDKCSLLVEYESIDFDLRIEILISEFPNYKDFFCTRSRKIYSSEYHYFIGTSTIELEKIKIRSYFFEHASYNDYKTLYGGDVVLTNRELINNIITQLG